MHTSIDLFHSCIRSTLYRYYLVWSEHQADMQDPASSSFKAKLPYNLFRAAWLEYARLLDLQLDSAFCCPECGPAPDIMVCDATTLAFRQQYDCWKDLLQDQAKPCDSAVVEGR